MRIVDIAGPQEDRLDEYFQPRERPYGRDSYYVDMITNTVLMDPKLRKYAVAMAKNPSVRTAMNLRCKIDSTCSKWLKQTEFNTITSDDAIDASLMDLLNRHSKELLAPQEPAKAPADQRVVDRPSMSSRFAQSVSNAFRRPQQGMA